MRPDARKSLEQLRRDWENCVRCTLGIQRQNFNGKFVHGEGTRRGIMFIGEGPGRHEEDYGRPFIGDSGNLLRKILKALGFTEHYLTNLVACRSCEHVLDENQQPRFRQNRRGPPMPVLQDVPPTPPQWRECRERLYEEIYLVDPVLIVSLGNTAAEALIGKPLTITREHGKPVTITVPGRGYDAVLTEKKKEWYHKVRGAVVAPVKQADVDYLLVPTLHPAYVLRKIADKGHDSPFRLLLEDVRKAVKIYEAYLQEVFHMTPTGASDATWEEVQHTYYSQEEA
jgi:uracil-DNA glycosylase